MMEFGRKEFAAVTATIALAAGGPAVAKEVEPVASASAAEGLVSFEDCDASARVAGGSFALDVDTLRANGKIVRAAGDAENSVEVESIKECDGTRTTEDWLSVNGHRLPGTTLRTTGKEAETKDVEKRVSLTALCKKFGKLSLRKMHKTTYTQEGHAPSVHTDNLTSDSKGNLIKSAKVKC